jgi:hypothetical protein
LNNLRKVSIRNSSVTGVLGNKTPKTPVTPEFSVQF